MCNHCGGRFVVGDHGSREDAQVTALRTWLQETEDDRLPPTVVRTYGGRSQPEATRIFEQEAGLLADRGYYPTAQSWADGRPGVARVVTIGLFANSLRPDGSLTVTFVRGTRPGTTPVAPERATKRCPDCAEDVLAEARVCRFCRYEFSD